MIETVKQLLNAVGRFAVVASADEWGLVHLSHVTIVDVAGTTIYFTDSGDSELAKNISFNPKVSFSIVDIKTFSGVQVKGAVREVTDVKVLTDVGKTLYYESVKSNNQPLFRLDIAEIYDVLQKNPEQSLRTPQWTNPANTGYQGVRVSYKPFSAPKPQAMPSLLKSSLETFASAMLEKLYPSFVGTAETGGTPNISPRFLLQVQNEFLLWGDKFKNKTFLNFSRPSPISSLMMNWETLTGYELKGWAQFHFFGKTIQTVHEYWSKLGFSDPLQAVHFYPEEVYRIENGKRTRVWTSHERTEWLTKSTLLPVVLPPVEESGATVGNSAGSNGSTIAGNSGNSANLSGTSRSTASTQPLQPAAPVSDTPNLLEMGKPVLAVLGDNPFLDWATETIGETASVISLTKERESQPQKLESIKNHLRLQPTLPVTVISMMTGDSIERDFRSLSTLFNFIGLFLRGRTGETKLKIILPSLKSAAHAALHFSMMNAVESFVKTYNQMTSADIEIAHLPLPMEQAGQTGELPAAIQDKLREKLLSLVAVAEYA